MSVTDSEGTTAAAEFSGSARFGDPALVAAGALHAGAPVIGEARAVLAVLRPDGADPAVRSRDLAGPWRSLVARWGQTGGPVCTIIPVGAVTPSFDGVRGSHCAGIPR